MIAFAFSFLSEESFGVFWGPVFGGLKLAKPRDLAPKLSIRFGCRANLARGRTNGGGAIHSVRGDLLDYSNVKFIYKDSALR